GAGTFSAPTPALTDGQHEVVVSVRDRANNTTQARSLVLVDATPPELVITSPTEGAVLGAPSVTVTGTVRDASAVQVTVNGQPAVFTQDLSASLFAGSYSAMVQLVNGPNTITVETTDVVGNVSTASRHVSVIPTAATRIQGEVRDTEGNPLVHVRVAVVADDAQTYTDANGQF